MKELQMLESIPRRMPILRSFCSPFLLSRELNLRTFRLMRQALSKFEVTSQPSHGSPGFVDEDFIGGSDDFFKFYNSSRTENYEELRYVVIIGAGTEQMVTDDENVETIWLWTGNLRHDLRSRWVACPPRY